MFGPEANLSDRPFIRGRSLFNFVTDFRRLLIKFEIFLFSCFIIVLNLDMNEQIKFVLRGDYFLAIFKT